MSTALPVLYRDPVSGKLDSLYKGYYEPEKVINFNGLPDLNLIVGNDTGSVPGKRFDNAAGAANAHFAGGYGMRATTSLAMSGGTSCAKLTIKQGSDGDPAGADTGVGMGPFGGNVTFPRQVLDGEEFWFGFHIYLEPNFSWDTNSGSSYQIKFIRIENNFTTDKQDIYILNSNLNGHTPAREQVGWLLANEFDPTPPGEVEFLSSAKIPEGQWVWVEEYVKVSSTKAGAIRRFWIDNVLVYEINGANVKHINNSGSYQNTTIATGGQKTLPNASAYLTQMRIFTYWNGYAPRDNTCYLQDIGFETRPAYLTIMDSFGNKMIGKNSLDYLRA